MESVFNGNYSTLLPYIEKHGLYTVYGVYKSTDGDIDKCLDLLNANKVGFNHESFKEAQNNIDARIAFLTTEPLIQEGFLVCKKCNKNKVSWTSLQTRSTDEATTIFAHCMTCGHRWRE